MQADGLGDLYRDVNGSNANYGDAGDPFPGLTGKTQFTDQTIPNSRPYQYDRNADGMVDVAGNSGVSVSSIAVGPEGVISCVVAGPAGTAFELGYDAGHFENVHNKWGENRAGIMLVPATSCYLRNVRTVFRNSSPEQHLEGYTIRVWRGFDERRRRPTSLIHSQSGTVDWTASDPEREGGWVTLPIQGDVLCEAGVGHYLEVEYTGFGYVMPYDGDWYTGRLPSGRSYWRLSGTDACTPFAYGDWNLHAILQEAAQATVTP
jgi:hypothetical protein